MEDKSSCREDNNKIFFFFLPPLLTAASEMSFDWEVTMLLTLLTWQFFAFRFFAFHQGTERVRTISRRDMIKLGHSESLLGKKLLFSVSEELFCPSQSRSFMDIIQLFVTSRSQAALNSEILHMGVIVHFVCSLWAV